MKSFLSNYLGFMKEHRNDIKNVKLVLLLIVNIWLFAIFWKILLISDTNIINTNQTLNKASLLLQPILSILGIDILTPNMLKMIILSFIVMFTNLSILYFNQMASIIILSVFARYSYKSYTNYLINQENLNYLGFENKKEVLKEIPQAIIQEAPPIMQQSTGWGIWIALGVSVLLIGAYVIYIQNDLSNNIIATNENMINMGNNIKNINNNINERITRSTSQIDYNNNYTTKLFSGVDDKLNLVNEKVENLSSTVQNIGEKLTKVAELNNKNTLELSKQSLNLSRQASEALTEISQASTTVEATTVGLAHIWEIVKGFSTRIEVLEAKSNIQTPRGSIHMKLPSNINKNNDDF